MRSEREHLAERLEEIAPPGEAGDRERIVAYALRCGSQTMTDDEAFAAARDLLGENGTGPGSEADDVEPKGPFAVTLDDFVDTEREHAEALIGSEDDCILPAYALGMLIARGGKGKTTWSIDFTCHAASAVE